MPQTGYTPIIHYRSTTSGNVPSASDLNPGELGINIADNDMSVYMENASGVVKRVFNNPAALKYPTTDGSANQVVKTDGSGTLAFYSLTASRALVSDGSGGLGVSATTSTELGYVSGVTSAIQTQINSKITAVSSTDGAIVRFDGTSGAVQNSGVLVTDDNHVKIPSTGGGSVEIAAPVTASNYVLTAPATSGTILNDASSLAATNLTGDVAAARITNALNASGSAPIYACRAWVNFNGTGTVAIRASGNVSSITDNGTGDYTVNFTAAMPDANYAAVASARRDSDEFNTFTQTYSTTSVNIGNWVENAGRLDSSIMNVSIFR